MKHQTGVYNAQLRKDIMDAIREGYSVHQIADLLGYSGAYISGTLTELVNAGSLIRVKQGVYEIPANSSEAPNPERVIERKNGAVKLAEAVKRTVSLPEYMRGRQAVTLFVERSPEEVENVMRLELCIGATWIPIPLISSVRLCVGDDIPRYSPTQETYNEVRAYRVTFATGVQQEFNHNPDVPLTIDRRLS